MVPVMAGAVVSVGVRVTRSVVAEKEVVEPTELVAVTRTRRCLPATAASGVYVLLVAPAIAVQPVGSVVVAAPAVAQLNHA
jgi:hypothetical protein